MPFHLSGVVEHSAGGSGHDLLQRLALQLGVARDRRVELCHVFFQQYETRGEKNREQSVSARQGYHST